MATLARETIQKLAVLRTLSLWKEGANGPVRLHKTLFFADKRSADQKVRFFTFKRWSLGQYSDDIASALNELQNASKIKVHFDGPSERLEAMIAPKKRNVVKSFFATHFPAWDQSLKIAFREWVDLTDDQILIKAPDDRTYKMSDHGAVIAESRLTDTVTLTHLDSDTAELLTDLVDDVLADKIRGRLRDAERARVRRENWRSIYFDRKPARTN